MASVRKFKKEVDNQMLEVISDCLLYSGLHPDSNREELNDIIEDAVKLRNDLIGRANNPVSTEGDKDIKRHYQAIKSDLRLGADNLCARLSAVSKKK
jgi:cation diffusion facilitator CzcD-associated flavoprotein CzcO